MATQVESFILGQLILVSVLDVPNVLDNCAF